MTQIQTFYEVVEYDYADNSGRQRYHGTDELAARSCWQSIPFGIFMSKIGFNGVWQRIDVRRKPSAFASPTSTLRPAV